MAQMSRMRSQAQGPASVYRQTPELPPMTQAALAATSTGTAGAAPPPAGGTGGNIGFPTTQGGIQAPVDPSTPITPPPTAQPYQAQGPALGLEGFDAGKLAGGHISPKYVFAQHAQGLGAADRDELLRRLQADPSGYFTNASWGGNKGDTLNVGGTPHADFNGVTQFDVIRAMGEGGKGWQWGGIGGSPVTPEGGMPQSPQGWTLPYPQPAGGDLGNAAPGGLNPNGMPFYGADILRYLAQQLGLANVVGGQIGQR